MIINSKSKEFQHPQTNKKGFDKMNLEEYKKYVKEMCKNIKEKLDEESEEFDFFLMLVKTFNKICNENLELEQALDKIEKYIENHKRKSKTCIMGLKCLSLYLMEILKILKL